MSIAATLLASAEKLLWGGTLVGCAALALKLCAHGLQRTFPLFVSFLIFRLLRGLGMYYLPPRTNLYGRVWLITEPLMWLAYILVVLELYSLVLRKYTGIASLGRWVRVAALVISIGLSGLTLRLDLSNPAEAYRWILSWTSIERGVMTSLAIFLFVITLFLVWYPVPLSRNVLVHSMVCAVYFLGSTMGLLVRNLTGAQATMMVNVGMNVLDLACLIMWAALLSRAGERSTMVIRHNWRPEEQERLMDQLSTINATLLRTARKPGEG